MKITRIVIFMEFVLALCLLTGCVRELTKDDFSAIRGTMVVKASHPGDGKFMDWIEENKTIIYGKAVAADRPYIGFWLDAGPGRSSTCVIPTSEFAKAVKANRGLCELLLGEYRWIGLSWEDFERQIP